MMRTAVVLLSLLTMLFGSMFPFGVRAPGQTVPHCAMDRREFTYIYDVLHPLASIKNLLENDHPLNERIKNTVPEKPRKDAAASACKDILIPGSLSLQSSQGIHQRKIVAHLSSAIILLFIDHLWQLGRSAAPPGFPLLALFLLYLVVLAKSHLPGAVALTVRSRFAQSR